MTPTPEPGQPVWIAAEVVASVAGHPMLTPITADGQPSMIRLAPTRYRWQPVPPQPPVLDEGMAVRVADDPSPWKIHTIAVKEELGWWSATVRLKPDLGATRARRATAAAAPLADVPGPDDSTPTPEPADDPQWAISLHLRCGDHSPFGVECDRVANHSGRHMACGLDLEVRDSWANEPQPAGEGAALIAATAQETAQPANPAEWVPMLEVLAGQADAWEATARRACAKLDELVRSVGVIRPWLVRHGFPAGDTRHLPQQAVDALEELHGDVEAAQQAPVQATTHGEAGEAQEGAEGAAEQFNLDTVRCPDCGNEITGILNEGDSFPRHKSPTTSQGCPYPSTRALIVAEHFTRRRKPAVQGAGRDLVDKLAKLIALEFAEAARLGLAKPGPNFMAERLVAALGLHDLEQAAAEATRLRRVNDEWGLTMSTLIDGLAERGVPVKLGHRYTQAALDALDSARRELEQLRGEVARVADWFERMADTIGEGPYTDRYLRYAKRVRAALAAAAAPATQDGDPK